MKHAYLWMLALALACLPLSACEDSESSVQEDEVRPATVEHLDGPEPTRVTLLPEAARRIDIQTEPVSNQEIGGRQQQVMPHAAVLYDTEGNTWTYTNPEPLVYVRHRVEVSSIEGETAILSDGPPAGTPVVIVGAVELYGSELEFEEE